MGKPKRTTRAPDKHGEFVKDDESLKEAVRTWNKGYNSKKIENAKRKAEGDAARGSEGADQSTAKKKGRVRSKPKSGASGLKPFRARPEEPTEVQAAISLIPVEEDTKDMLLIQRCNALRRKAHMIPDAPRQEGASSVMDLDAAIKAGVRQSTAVLVDWSSYQARCVGHLCKVYWDGDNVWFYGRILYYDHKTDMHFVFYMEDSTTEWLNLSNESTVVGPDICLARMNAGTFYPAQRFYASVKGREALKKTKGYNKAGDLVEFFGAGGRREVAFLTAGQIKAYDVAGGKCLRICPTSSTPFPLHPLSSFLYISAHH
jgi:hypothetical protein